MESKHFLLAALYLGPFLLPVFMPEWRRLAVIGAIGLAFGIWLFVFKLNETGGLSLAVEKVFYAIAFWGLAAGICTRVITLALTPRSLPFWVISVITIAGALVPPAVFLFGLK